MATKDELINLLNNANQGLIPTPGLYKLLIDYVSASYNINIGVCRERFKKYTAQNWLQFLS